MPEFLKLRHVSGLPDGAKFLTEVPDAENLRSLILEYSSIYMQCYGHTYGLMVLKITKQEDLERDSLWKFISWLFDEELLPVKSPGGGWRKQVSVYVVEK